MRDAMIVEARNELHRRGGASVRDLIVRADQLGVPWSVLAVPSLRPSKQIAGGNA